MKRIIADLDFIGRKSAYFALAKRATVFHDTAGKKINRFDVSVTRVKEEDLSSLPEGMPVIEIKHLNSRMCDELQLVDLVSGAIFRNFEHSEEKYLRTLKQAGAKLREIRSRIRE